MKEGAMSEHNPAGSGDRIERSIEIRAPLRRVWQALVDAREFGAWFGVALEGERLVAGQEMRGRITHPGYEHLVFTAAVERVEPELLLSFRWHPYAVDPTVDYSGESTTLVVFELEPVADGTRVRVTESGFDALPAARRAEAFRMNSQGWDAQMHNIERHVVA
jgi:uncharacterized protein YndB with AHSA1/START domain